MSYRLGLYEKSMPGTLSWNDKIKRAKEAGFDFLEISIDETDEKLERLNSSKAERLELVELMYKSNFKIETMCLSGHRKYPLGSMDSEIRTKGMKIMEKAIDLASELGITIIQLAGYDVYYEKPNEQTREFFEGNLKKAVELAAIKGVILGFETMETEFMNTVEKAMEYVNVINSPYLNVYPDIGNIKNSSLLYNTSVFNDLETGNGKIVAAHLKETTPGIFREVRFGEGHVDFEKNIKKLYSLNVRRFVAEFWYTGNEDWEEELHYANQFIREKFSDQTGRLVSSYQEENDG